MEVSPEQRREKARLAEEAINQSLRGQWEESIRTNEAILAIDDRDMSAMNRIGRSLTKLGRIQEALEVYQRATAADPANAIARRNVVRLMGSLEAMTGETRPESVPVDLQTDQFVMDTGRSAVVSLDGLGVPEDRATVMPGDQLDLRAEGPYLRLYTRGGYFVGLAPARYARRLMDLMALGNEYRALVVNSTFDSVQVLIQEVRRTPESHGRLPFPIETRRTSDTRAALREAALVGQTEEEFLADLDLDEELGEDEAVDETETEPLPEAEDTEDIEE